VKKTVCGAISAILQRPAGLGEEHVRPARRLPPSCTRSCACFTGSDPCEGSASAINDEFESWIRNQAGDALVFTAGPPAADSMDFPAYRPSDRSVAPHSRPRLTRGRALVVRGPRALQNGGRSVKTLDYEAYAPLAQKEGRRIVKRP